MSFGAMLPGGNSGCLDPICKGFMILSEVKGLGIRTLAEC